MISVKQIRAARGLLNWTQKELGDKASVSREAIKNIETEISRPRKDTLNDIQKAFEDHGVEFLPGDGLRMLDATVHVLHGEDGIKALWDDIYETIIASDNKEILIANNTEPLALGKSIVEYLDMHLKRLKAAKIHERILCREGDTNFLGPITSYRWVPKENFCDSPTFIYAGKVAMLVWGPPAKVTIINDPQYAESIRNLFKFSWDRARIPEMPE
jgi:transcriptional regulator with XRE-family HTH domain